MPYCLGEVNFSSKKAIKEHVRRVREATKIGGRINDGAVQELLKKPPDWESKSAGGGYLTTAMATFKQNLRPSKEIAIQFPGDRPAMDISWNWVVELLNPDGSIKDPNHDGKKGLKDFRDAARNDISPQIMAFCQKGFQVDHVYPKTFEALLFEWVKSTGLRVGEILIQNCSGIAETGKSLADFRQRTSWQKFHAENAELELVTMQEHLSRPKLTMDWSVIL